MSALLYARYAQAKAKIKAIPCEVLWQNQMECKSRILPNHLLTLSPVACQASGHTRASSRPN